MKINFEKLPCYVDIRKAATKDMDVRYDFANQMYIHGSGVAMGALAMKIYNSNGEEEYNDEECKIIIEFSKNFPPIFSESIQNYINKQKE